MKRILAENSDVKREAEALRQKQLNEAFRNTSFTDLITNNTVQVSKKYKSG